MSRRKSHGYFQAVPIGVLLFGMSSLFSVGHAQYTTATVADGSLGTMVTGTTDYKITGGDSSHAPNLFHSFQTFGVPSGGSADFIVPSNSIQNVISRVTGTMGSQIDGKITSTYFDANTNTFPISSANLWLINPNGILFGEGAQLDIGGSFYASTANNIKLGNGSGIFSASLTDPMVLDVAAPSAFGFLTANPAPIDVRAGTFDLNIGFFTSVFQVPIGQTLSFVGGPVNVGAPGFPFEGFSFVRAPNGRVNIVSVASPGDATFDGTGFNVDAFPQLGPINITGGSIVDGGEVFIRGGALVISNATIYPGFFGQQAPFPTPSGAFAPPLAGGEVNVSVTNAVDIKQPGLFTRTGIQTFNGSDFDIVGGDSPDIFITAGSFSLANGAQIVSNRNGPGDATDIVITAADTVDVLNGAAILMRNFFGDPNDPSNPSGGGTLTITAKNVTLDSASSGGFTGLSAQGNFHPNYGRPGLAPPLSAFSPFWQFADSGSISINASDLLKVSGKAQINTDSFAFGRSGDVTVTAGDVSLIGAGAQTGLIGAQSALSGASGDITIEATGKIEIENGFRISGSTFGSEDGGIVRVTADNSITLTGADSRIVSGAIQLSDPDLDYFAKRLDPVFQFFGTPPITDYATLRAVLGIAPHPGDLMEVLAVLNSIRVGNPPLPLVAVTDFTPGNGGIVDIATPLLTMNGDSRIETSTGWGEIVQVGPDTFQTFGNAGDITANVGSLSLNNGAAIRSTSGIQRLTGDFSFGLGEAGSIMITADDSITLSGGSSISTEAELADGGNIKLTAPNIVQLTDSEITTSIFGQGAGDGGNINIDPETVLLIRSQIIANAFAGQGGNIQITAGSFIKDASSVVQASSQFGVQGTIVVASPENDIAGSISQLPQSIVDVSGLLPERCAARYAGGPQSSFAVAGRGGLPTNPDNYLPTFNAGSVPLKSAGGPPSGTTETALTSVREIAVAMAAWNCVPGSERQVHVQDMISRLF